mmetsp:Transcript_7452/g.26223  ORF Transcript_7452/g.26223 Transcript_7452/m.26223 type:complete len:285 (-) Transcript_7452:15-869(-)
MRCTRSLAPLPSVTASPSSAALFATASSLLSAATSFCDSLSSELRLSTRPTTSSGFTFSAPASAFTTPSRLESSSAPPGPATASMRRTPAATPPSESTLKPPTSAVFATCVPPHSSIDTPGTSTTRTVSPYFSPNIIVAPASFACASGISDTARGVASITQPLTSASTRSMSAASGALGDVKSKRRRSKATIDPACATSGPRTSTSAAWRRCVAVWLHLARSLSSASTLGETESPTSMAPAATVAAWAKSRPPATFCTSDTAASPAPPAATSAPRSPTCPPLSA